MTDITDWLLGPPLKIVLILIAAAVLNRVARRAVKRSLTRLHTGAVRERMGAMRRRTPAALLETGETSLRAEQRIDALSSVLRNVVTFVIWLVAVLMCLDEVGIDLAPLLAASGISSRSATSASATSASEATTESGSPAPLRSALRAASSASPVARCTRSRVSGVSGSTTSMP